MSAQISGIYKFYLIKTRIQLDSTIYSLGTVIIFNNKLWIPSCGKFSTISSRGHSFVLSTVSLTQILRLQLYTQKHWADVGKAVHANIVRAQNGSSKFS